MSMQARWQGFLRSSRPRDAGPCRSAAERRRHDREPDSTSGDPDRSCSRAGRRRRASSGPTIRPAASCSAASAPDHVGRFGGSPVRRSDRLAAIADWVHQDDLRARARRARRAAAARPAVDIEVRVRVHNDARRLARHDARCSATCSITPTCGESSSARSTRPCSTARPGGARSSARARSASSSSTSTTGARS